MAIGKWTIEKINERIEYHKRSTNYVLNNWDIIKKTNIKNGRSKVEATKRLKFSIATDAEYIGRCYALIGDGKEARAWFRKSAESMSFSDFTDTRCLRMLWTAVLSGDKKFATNIASKMLNAGVVQKSLHEIIKKQCELFAYIILNKEISQEYLTELEKLEDKQRKSISGMPSGTVKCCCGILKKDKRIVMDSLSTMIPFTRRFYGQMKGDIPVAMEEAMLIILAKDAGIEIGPENFPKYNEILPACLFEQKSK